MTNETTKSKRRTSKSRTSSIKAAPKGKRTTRNPTAKAAAKKVVAQADEMVTALISQAKKGNHQSAKFLFDFAGIYPCPVEGSADESNEKAASVASQLMHLIKLPCASPDTETDSVANSIAENEADSEPETDSEATI